MTDKKLAYLDGWFAHKEGLSHNANPYNDCTQSASNNVWVKGWTDRFNAIKHDLDLSTDDEFPWQE